LTIANELYKHGLNVMAVPKTIDNDLDKTFTTFGFDTAVSFATECIDRLHSTAESHQRVMVVEVMGRYAGWIALHAGIAGGAHAILIPEIDFDLDKVAEKIRERDSEGSHHSLVVVAEGARPHNGQRVVVTPAAAGQAERLGGIGEEVARGLAQRTGKETRAVVLGHLLRGGSPTAFDRIAAQRFGTAAVRGLAQGKSGVMVALAFPNVNYVSLAEVAGRMKNVPQDSDTLQTARDLGISFGD
jgi:6-phosphofructokinase 1